MVGQMEIAPTTKDRRGRAKRSGKSGCVFTESGSMLRENSHQ
jgi:hypothetical protein